MEEDQQRLIRGDSSSTDEHSDQSNFNPGEGSVSGSATRSTPSAQYGAVGDLCRNVLAIPSGVAGISYEIETRKWKEVGKVENICYYPIDGGAGFLCRKALCTVNGLIDITADDDDDDTQSYRADRCLVPYLLPNMVAKVQTRVPKLDLNFQQLIHALLMADTNSIIHLNYLGTNIPVQADFNIANIKDKCKKLFEHKNMKVSYFSQEDRTSLLVDKLRFTKEVDGNRHINGFLANYSHYTLINNESVSKLKTRYNTYCMRKKYKKDDISFECFSPHIVVKGKHAFFEDKDDVEYVKIGNVIFSKIIPCVHTEDINYNYKNPNKPFFNFHKFLKSIRPLSYKNVAGEELIMPMFGINMEICEDQDDFLIQDENRKSGIIELGDAVFVSYREKLKK